MPIRLILRSRTQYWPTHLAVVVGVAVAVAVLTESLLAVDSVRGSLRQLALQRLGVYLAIDEADWDTVERHGCLGWSGMGRQFPPPGVKQIPSDGAPPCSRSSNHGRAKSTTSKL